MIAVNASNSPSPKRHRMLDTINHRLDHLAAAKGRALNNRKQKSARPQPKASPNPNHFEAKRCALPPILENFKVGDQIQKSHPKLKRIHIKACIFAAIGGIIGLIDYELFFQNKLESSRMNWILRAIVSWTTLLLLRYIYLHYKELVRIMILREIVEPKTGLFSTSLRWAFLFETFICLVHCPPGVDWKFSIKQVNLRDAYHYSFCELATIFYSMRIYLVYRLYSSYSFWTTPRAQRVLRFTCGKASTLFVFKADLKRNPYTTIAITFALSVLIFGWWTIIFERPYNPQFRHYWNGQWLVIVTMTATGYGEIYPETYMARLVALFAAILGNFFISLSVVAITNALEFTNKEIEAYKEMVDRNMKKQRLIPLACKLIQRSWRLKKLRVQEADPRRRFLVMHDLSLIRRRFGIKRRYTMSNPLTIRDQIEAMQSQIEDQIGDNIIMLDPIFGIKAKIKDSMAITDKYQMFLRRYMRRLARMKEMMNRFTRNHPTDLQELNAIEDVRIIEDTTGLSMRLTREESTISSFSELAISQEEQRLVKEMEEDKQYMDDVRLQARVEKIKKRRSARLRDSNLPFNESSKWSYSNQSHVTLTNVSQLSSVDQSGAWQGAVRGSKSISNRSRPASVQSKSRNSRRPSDGLSETGLISELRTKSHSIDEESKIFEDYAQEVNFPRNFSVFQNTTDSSKSYDGVEVGKRASAKLNRRPT